MRILFFADRSFPTDHSFLEGLIEHRVASKEHEITWVMYGRPGAEAIETRRWEFSKVITVPPSKRRDPFSMTLRSIANYWKLRNVLTRRDKFCPDVIVVRNDLGFLKLGQFLGKVWGRRVVFQLSHLKEEQFLSGSSENGYWQNLMDRLKGAGGLCLRDFLAPKADAMLCISDAMRSYLLKRYKYQAANLHVLPLGVDLYNDVESPVDSSSVAFNRKGQKEFCFVYCGTMASVRRLDKTIRAFKVASDSLAYLRLILVGGGREPKEVAFLHGLVNELGIEDKVSFKGQLRRLETRHLLRQCHVGLCVTPPKGVLRYISPTKLMEYMEAALPVIATKGIAEQEEVVTKSKGGVLVEFEVEDVANAMKKLAGDRNMALNLGQQGRAYIANNRNYDLMADQFVQIVSQYCR